MCIKPLERNCVLPTFLAVLPKDAELTFGSSDALANVGTPSNGSLLESEERASRWQQRIDGGNVIFRRARGPRS